MSPLRDAMRLVDGEQGKAGARQEVEEALGEQALGCDVEQLQPPAMKSRSTARASAALRLELR